MAEPITYLDPARVTGKKQTEAPLSRSRTGYGNKLPTSWLLQLDAQRWYRVYVICHSNCGSAYILVGGKLHFLGSYDPATDPVALPSSVNTPRMEKRVRRAFHAHYRARTFETIYEHGHWWVRREAHEETETYDAVDAEGGASTLGFAFERV